MIMEGYVKTSNNWRQECVDMHTHAQCDIVGRCQGQFWILPIPALRLWLT